MEELFEEYGYEEILVEVAWLSQMLRDEGKLRDELEHNSWEEKGAGFAIAKHFYEENKDRQWEHKDEFYDAVYEFAELMLKRED